MKNLKRLILAFAFIYTPIAANAWGVLGHRIVGEVADSYLSANARKAIKQILGNETLAMSANWAGGTASVISMCEIWIRILWSSF